MRDAAIDCKDHKKYNFDLTCRILSIFYMDLSKTSISKAVIAINTLQLN